METNTYMKNLNEIKKSCEKLITETQSDIEIFLNEQQNLRRQIQEISVENNRINSKVEVLKNATTNSYTIKTGGDSKDDATRQKLTEDALSNLKTQNDYLQTENNDLRSLNKTCQKHIETLENEIQNYRNQLFNPTSVCEVKHKYDTTIKLLEGTIKHKNNKLKEQSKIVESLLEQKETLIDRIEENAKLLAEKSEELEKYSENVETITRLQEQVAATERHNKELQKSLKISRQAIEKRIIREQNALQKVQEALNVAEAAVAVKEEALKRERIVKEECDIIASTIGHVMDEAAHKVDTDIESIKNKYLEKEKLIKEEKSKLSQEIQSHQNFIKILEGRCKRYEQKCIDGNHYIDNLTTKLDQAIKALWKLEEKIKKTENQNKEENQQKSSIDQDNKIQQFVQNNKILRERYSTTIIDFTEKFQNKIDSLKEEVARLEAENEALKLQNSN